MEPLPLRDIHLPAAIGWWPPAPGWWLALLAAIGLVALSVWLVLRWRRVTPIKLARRELDALANAPELAPDEKLRRLSILLRRTALSLYPRQQVAGLTGAAWLDWLDATLGEPRFSQGPGRSLTEAPYRPRTGTDIEPLLALSRDWLRALAKTKAAHRALAPVRKTPRP
ncbi:protein of unknown function [Methylomagnum ishizawai]|uniref:DUF4381 domain-containing protein n=1 Tax=Methylomagnum ishizawai TaxID=1760988 RepID=A0A1Y6D3D8_9GAMM|nr:DUF4381 domain-containing protein [Methylomagnum ishizawai]SMF97167.1 protein of unknown function [Methylomagnum ishizawai]